MNGPDLVDGRRYALRLAYRDHESALDKVTYIGPLRNGQAKVRWLEGDDADREEWVRTVQILCPWGERKAVLKDEQRQDLLLANYRRDRDQVVEDAIEHVMAACGEGNCWKTWDASPAVIERMWRRASLKRGPLEEAFAYADRHGQWHLSYDSAHRWARSFAATEPETVTLYLDRKEQEALAAGVTPGNYWEHDHLRTSRPAIALARDWTRANVHDHLEREIDRLRGVASRAISYLKEKGHEDYARRLDRDLRGR